MADAKITLSAFDKTQAAFQSAQRGLDTLHTKAVAVSGALGVLGITAFAADMAAGIHQAIEQWDELGKAAQRAGFQSAQGMAEFQYAAKLAGVDAGGFEQAVGKLSEKLADAAGGSEKATELFRAMGVRIKDAGGNLRDTEAVVTDLAKAFSGWRDGPEKTALALEIFGKAGKQLIPLLNGGAEGVNELREEFRRLRGAMSDGTSKAAEHFNDNLMKMETVAGGLKREIAESLLPSLNQVTDAMVEEAKKGNALLSVWVGLKEAAKEFFRMRGDSSTGGKKEQLDLLEESLRIGGDKDGKLAARIAQLRQEVFNTPELQRAAAEAEAAYYGAGANVKPRAPTPPKDGTAKENPYAAINKGLQERIALGERQLALGRDLSDAEKIEAKTLADLEAQGKKSVVVTKEDVLASLEKAKAIENELDLRKAQQQNNKEFAKDWEKTEKELAAAQEARSKASAQMINSLQQEREQQEDANALLKAEAGLIGATEVQREVALGNLKVELDLKRRLAEIDKTVSPEQRDRARADAEQTAELAKQGVAMRAVANEQQRIWQSIDETAHDVFVNMWDEGSDTFKRLGKSLKASFLDLLYQATIRPFLINVVASVTGQGSPLAALAGSGGIGGLGGLGGLGNVGTALQSAVFPGGWSLSTMLGGSAASTSTSTGLGLLGAEEAAAYGAGASGALGAIGTAMPYLGAALIAAQALGLFKHGGPKTESGFGYGIDRTPNAGAAQAIAKGIQAQYASMASALGGAPGALDLGVFTAQDPQGTAMTQLQVAAALNGRSIYSRASRLGGTENVGRSDAELQAAIAEETERVVLEALQASNLTGAIGDYLKQLGDIDSLSGGSLEKAMAHIQQAQALELRLFELTATEEEKLARAREQELAGLDDVNQATAKRIYALQDEAQAQQKAAAAIERAVASSKSAAEFMAGVHTNVREYLGKLDATPAGMLSPELQLGNARSQFDTQLALARAGDRTALQNITQYADQLAQAQTGYTASGPGTQATLAYIRQQLAGLPGMKSAEEYLADVIKTAKDEQIVAARAVGDQIWNGLWGQAGYLATHLDEIDSNVDGLLSFDELKAGLGGLATDDTLHALMAKYDTNGDGQISKLEAIRASVDAVNGTLKSFGTNMFGQNVDMVNTFYPQGDANNPYPNSASLQGVVLNGAQYYLNTNGHLLTSTGTDSGIRINESNTGYYGPNGAPYYVDPATSYWGIKSYAVGTPYVPNDGLAYLHQGERVLTRQENSGLDQQLAALREEVRAGFERVAQVNAAGFRGTISGVQDVAENTADTKFERLLARTEHAS